MNFFDAVLQAVNTLVQQNLGIFDGMGQNLRAERRYLETGDFVSPMPKNNVRVAASF